MVGAASQGNALPALTQAQRGGLPVYSGQPRAVLAGEKIEQTLREMAPDAEIHFERVAVTLEQIRDLDLPTRPTKMSDSRSKGFGDISVEIDAIPPDHLRHMVREVIERHLPPHQFAKLKVAEESEREVIGKLVGRALTLPHSRQR